MITSRIFFLPVSFLKNLIIRCSVIRSFMFLLNVNSHTKRREQTEKSREQTAYKSKLYGPNGGSKMRMEKITQRATT
jgi:hypothetical protein